MYPFNLEHFIFLKIRFLSLSKFHREVYVEVTHLYLKEKEETKVKNAHEYLTFII